MSANVRLACDPEVVEVPLDQLLPTRRLDDAVRKSAKYRCIEASVRELGLIEPLVIFPQGDVSGRYMLLDGHVRLLILKDLRVQTAKCLVAGDDEGFTYNHKVNRLAAIQEHYMILRAIKSGVSEERIARSLNVDVTSIRQKRQLLDGICPEAVQLLREKATTGPALRELRKVMPMRQIEMAELMCSTNTFSVSYTRCLVATTPAAQLIEEEREKEAQGLSPEDVARMEHEMASHAREFKLIEESHGQNALHLVVVVGYIKRITENARVARYLGQRHPEIQTEFQKLADSRALTDGAISKGSSG